LFQYDFNDSYDSLRFSYDSHRWLEEDSARNTPLDRSIGHKDGLSCPYSGRECGDKCETGRFTLILASGTGKSANRVNLHFLGTGAEKKV
jgi:hypothetical protein